MRCSRACWNSESSPRGDSDAGICQPQTAQTRSRERTAGLVSSRQASAPIHRAARDGDDDGHGLAQGDGRAGGDDAILALPGAGLGFELGFGGHRRLPFPVISGSQKRIVLC